MSSSVKLVHARVEMLVSVINECFAMLWLMRTSWCMYCKFRISYETLLWIVIAWNYEFNEEELLLQFVNDALL